MKKAFFQLVLVTAIILAHITVLSMGEAQAGDQTAALLSELFEASGANFLEVNVNSTLQVVDNFYGPAELKAMESYFIEGLGMRGEQFHLSPSMGPDQEFLLANLQEGQNYLLIQKEEEPEFSQILLTYVEPDQKVTVVKLYTAQLKEMKESYIIIDIVQNKGYKDIGELIQQNKKLLKAFGGEPETTISFTGTQAGSFTEAEEKDWIETLIRASGAVPVEKTVQAGYTSATLYTSRISKSLTYGEKKVNLQIASRYNEYEGKQYLWIGTPLITSTY